MKGQDGADPDRERAVDPDEYIFEGYFQALRELLPDVVRGDAEAEATLRMELAKTLRIIERRLLDRSVDPRECLQHAWLKLLEKIKDGWSPATVTEPIGFLESRAQWRAGEINKTYLRRPRHVSLSAAPSGDVGGGEGLEASLSSDARRDRAQESRIGRLREVMVELPEKDRRLLEWKYFDGLSYDEISDQTGLTPSQVARRLQQAREEVRRRFEE
jgi:RNA polymerase sigma factor (sigma-70 family)